jgi:hypothetical protein
MTTNFQSRTATEPGGIDRPDADQVRVSFDWLVPSRADQPLTFILEVKRGSRTSAIRFSIDLQKLVEADLERLYDFLVRRPKGYQLTFEIAWLLELAFEQEMPTSTVEVRHQKVRELLLCK